MAPRLSHYSPWLHGGKSAASQMWHHPSFTLPPFLFASVLTLILTRFILPNTFFSSQTPTLPASSVLALSRLPLQSYKYTSSTYGVNQQCPLKDERVWGEMLTHSWTWRTTLHIYVLTLGVFWLFTPSTCMCDYKYLTDLVSFKLSTLNVWISKSRLAHVTNDEEIGHTPA